MENLVGTGEASRRLGVAVTTIHEFIRSGQLPAVKTVLGYLIDREDLERFAAERAANPPRVGRPPKTPEPVA